MRPPNAFFAVLPPTEHGIVKLVTVSETGAMCVEKVAFNHALSEDPMWESPSGKYVVTKINTWPPGAVYRYIRKTPRAAPGDPLPSFPVTVNRFGVSTWRLAWLAWD